MTPLIRHPDGFSYGYSRITDIGEEADVGIGFGILRLAMNEEWCSCTRLETAYLLLDGRITFNLCGVEKTVERPSVFEDGPYALHCGSNTKVCLKARSDCQLAVVETVNDQPLDPMIFEPSNVVAVEERGKGLFSNSAFRIVCTIFDKRNRESSNLVIGETITPGGHWSSYPPHSHPHPEIYHYRFCRPYGYGHGEVGDDVYRIQEFDTLKIVEQKAHAQVAAPGYEMYYLWVLRHLPHLPYTSPTISEEHAWLLDQDTGAKTWEQVS